jgi:hypothetical protein
MLILQALSAGVVLCLGLVGWQTACQQPRQPGCILENFKRIHNSMTAAEVVAILGRPDCCDAVAILDGPCPPMEYREWHHPDGSCMVVVFEEGRVTARAFLPAVSAPPDQAKLHLFPQ